MASDISTYLARMGDRHLGLLTDADREALAQAVVCGAGAGGVAGWTYEALCRLGVRRFKIADPETFDPSNANRQRGCTSATVGRNKAEVTREILLALNPEAEVTVFAGGVTEANLGDFLRDGTVALDGIDLAKLEIKKRTFDAARAAGLPVLTCPILGFGTALAVFDPRRSPSFEEFFGPMPPASDVEARRRYVESLLPAFFSFMPNLDWPLFRERAHAGAVPSVGIATMLSGALAATAVVSIVCRRGSFPVVPVTLHVDLMEQRIATCGPLRRWLARQLIRRRFRRLRRPPAR